MKKRILSSLPKNPFSSSSPKNYAKRSFSPSSTETPHPIEHEKSKFFPHSAPQSVIPEFEEEKENIPPSLSASCEKFEISQIEIDEQINYLKSSLLDVSKNYFKDLLDIPRIISSSIHKKTIALGDADGSVGRMIMTAIQSGHMQLTLTLLNELVEILNFEAVCILYPISSDARHTDIGLDLMANIDINEEKYKENEEDFVLIYYQKNKEIALKTNNIVLNAKYCESNTRVVYNGDNINDRFSSHKTAILTFIKKMHEVGGIFIFGNHDTHLVFPYFDKRKQILVTDLRGTRSVQYGGHAVDHGFMAPTEMELRNKYEDFQKKYFVNCKYFEEDKLFFIHNGISLTKIDEHAYNIKSVFGEIYNIIVPIESNFLFKTIENAYNSITKYDLSTFIRFRLDDKFENDNFKAANIFPGVTIVHGHHGLTGEFGQIVNLNSTKDNGIANWFHPSAMQWTH